MLVTTRFAPSPTGYVHVGNARTALFNFLYARRYGGKFVLRIEDTDRQRSEGRYTQVILSALKWMGLDYDDLVYQSDNIGRHVDIAKQLLGKGLAYYCYTTKEELEKWKADNPFKKFVSPWRNNHGDYVRARPHSSPVVRLKIPEDGNVVVPDMVQGNVKFDTSNIEDIILLRSDNTPTYNLSVVVDDHDMSITHIIRGSDHLTNTPKQILIYQALGWNMPSFAHVPLIHDSDGNKMSKRTNTASVSKYIEEGILPDALCNYLLRLGWSLGDKEIISRDEAIQYFNTENIGLSPARFDLDKLYSLNHHYIMYKPINELVNQVATMFTKNDNIVLSKEMMDKLYLGMPELTKRNRDIIGLYHMSKIYVSYEMLTLSDEAKHILDTEYDQKILDEIISIITNIADDEYSIPRIKGDCKQYSKNQNIPMGKLAKHIRVSVTKTMNAPGIFEIIHILGKEETILRMKQFLLIQ